jgi:hypothetical protein
METKHTPAPWFCNGSNIVYLGNGDENVVTCERMGIDVDICLVFAQYEFDEDVQTALQDLSETEANVRLIAAAPELLSALKDLLFMASGKGEDPHSTMNWQIAQRNAISAINKALTGEPNE